ncbi:MAG: hypothetical protein IPL59_26515 [Candidatus Competibacteraceae bacterium]|nr:hypothetical protein [Candidatus Competibacteraceae bacterium]
MDADELLSSSALSASPDFIKEEVKTAAANFEKDTVALLEQLRRSSWSAWAVFAAIYTIGQQNGKKMTIKPFNKFDANFSFEQNAFAAPVELDKATPQGKRILACSSNPTGTVRSASVLTDPQGQPYLGRGGGSDTEIRFNALMWVPPPGGGAVAPGAEADEILLHEMGHGLRQMRGQMQCSGVSDNPAYDTREEFVAILISTSTGLSDGDRGCDPTTGPIPHPCLPLSDSATFLSTGNHRDYIHQMFEEDLLFAKNLSNVSCPFNPVKVFFEKYGKIFGGK